MKILSFDSAGEFCSAAVHIDTQLVAFDQDITGSLQAAELLIPMIDKVMKDAFLSYGSLDHIAVTKGPGSFTGIRVGLSAAQGLLMSTKASPLVFSNFELWNYRAKMQMGSRLDASVVVINAYSGQVYIQIFECSSNMNDPALINVEDLKGTVGHLSDKVVAFLGTGITNLEDPFFQRPNFFFLPRYTSAKFLGQLACDTIGLGKIHSTDLAPLYMKPPSVGVQKA
jgi:tRNA threonylcarbamoyladenosine biosynthesis protein TsaB